jgi:hypothetical protein
LPEEENRQRMQALEQRVCDLGHVVYHGKGVGTLGDWPAEPSLFVVGMGVAQAVEVAAAFGQTTIVVGRRGEAARLAWRHGPETPTAT